MVENNGVFVTTDTNATSNSDRIMFSDIHPLVEEYVDSL